MTGSSTTSTLTSSVFASSLGASVTFSVLVFFCSTGAGAFSFSGSLVASSCCVSSATSGFTTGSSTFVETGLVGFLFVLGKPFSAVTTVSLAIVSLLITCVLLSVVTSNNDGNVGLATVVLITDLGSLEELIILFLTKAPITKPTNIQ